MAPATRPPSAEPMTTASASRSRRSMRAGGSHSPSRAVNPTSCGARVGRSDPGWLENQPNATPDLGEPRARESSRDGLDVQSIDGGDLRDVDDRNRLAARVPRVLARRMDTVLFDVAERVATITLNRPDRLNAMNQQMRDELRACWQRVKDDPDTWVAIVTGAGRAFSSGADVEALATGGFVKPDRWRELAIHEGVALLPTPRRMRVQKPVIAAVNGVAAGVTLDLVTEADIPIASEQAEFVDPHVSLGYVSSHEMVNMARRVPVAVCLRMALLGRHERMSARRAYEVGLVTEVVPHESLMDRAQELAALVLKNAPLAVWGTKMAIVQGLGLPIPQAEEIAARYLEVVEQARSRVTSASVATKDGTRRSIRPTSPRRPASNRFATASVA